MDYVAADFMNTGDLAEGIYAISGVETETSQPETETPGSTVVTPECWISWSFKWKSHNTGSHSECEVAVTHCGDHPGNQLVMNIITNFPIKEIRDSSGVLVSNVSRHGFTLTRNNHFNPSETVVFNLLIVVDQDDAFCLRDEANNPLHGAIGSRNENDYYCSLGSYLCS